MCGVWFSANVFLLMNRVTGLLPTEGLHIDELVANTLSFLAERNMNNLLLRLIPEVVLFEASKTYFWISKTFLPRGIEVFLSFQQQRCLIGAQHVLRLLLQKFWSLLVFIKYYLHFDVAFMLSWNTLWQRSRCYLFPSELITGRMDSSSSMTAATGVIW